MSLYSHPPPGFGNPYSQQQPQPFVHHASPVVAYPYGQSSYPVHFSDPSSFRREYTARLSELTMNSRPIIQNLSMMAQNYIRYADIVAECLQVHIQRVPPWMKLSAFYVLDAISKNVFDPYAAKFSAFVVPLFLETFGQVDPPTRSKMEEMLVTWRSGAPSGKELFGVATQVSLERQIWGSDSSSTVDNSSRRQAQSKPLTKSQVLAELDVTLALKEQAYHANPYDSTSQSQVNVLHQLRRMVEHGVTQEELKQILSQLRAMCREPASALPPPPTQSPVPVSSVFAGSASVPSSHYGQSSTQVSSSVYPSLNNLTQPSILPSNATNVPSNISGISNLFQSLVKAGLVSGNSTPVGAGKDTSTPPPTIDGHNEEKIQADKTLEDDSLESQRSYARKIFDMKIRLNTSEISRQRPRNITTLYEAQPVKCKQCALRFSEGPLEKKKMAEHLDMHFRQNRRAKEATGRGTSRNWFISVQNWVSEPLIDLKGKGRDTSSTDKTADSSEVAKRDAVLRSSMVIVPAGDEAKTINCPVCKEPLKSEFQEDEEEWVWRNAVKVKDKIFHATCHAELSTSSTLASRLRAEGISGLSSSRAGTPEFAPRLETPNTTPKGKTQISKSPSPSRTLSENNSTIGVKRKAEEDMIQRGPEQTPPSKKLILSTA